MNRNTLAEHPRARVLIIDDNPAIHADFRKVLSTKPDVDQLADLEAELFASRASNPMARTRFEVESALQGQEGLHKVEQALRDGDPFPVAFVDMRMPPGWDGLVTIEHLWQVDPDLQVVICTAHADHFWSEVAQRLGNNDRWLILKKPFDNAEICQLAAALAEKRKLLDRVRAQMDDLEALVHQGTSALRDREARMLAMFDTAPDGIITFGSDGIVESANSTALKLFNYSGQELIGESVACLVDLDQAAVGGDVRELFGISCQESVASLEIDSIRGDASVFPAHWTVGYSHNTQHQFYTAIVRDLTEHRSLQCELAQAQKLESVGQLAAGIAHEINTPTQYVGDNVRFLKETFVDLMNVLGICEKLLAVLPEDSDAGDLLSQAKAAVQRADTAYLQEEIPKTLDETENGINRIASIVRAMKEFSHPGSDEKTLADLHDALQTSLTVSRNEWKYVAEVHTDFTPDMPHVPCLLGELNQVFLNLIVNAAHAIGDVVADNPPEKGTISIRTSYDDQFAHIYVSDTGTGVPAEIVGRLFDPFFTTKDVGKGTGQGLAIARSVIVDKHGGTIEVDTELGSGTTFCIRLPLVESFDKSIDPDGSGATNAQHTFC